MYRQDTDIRRTVPGHLVARSPRVGCGPVSDISFEDAYAPFVTETTKLLPAGSTVIDVHTHLGNDEDGRSLDLPTLLNYLDQISPTARACVFPLHDPDRHPAYQRPNDRVFTWADESDGRLTPFCRLDPGDDPTTELQRCLALGARGIKLHPRAQSFGFDGAAVDAIFAQAAEAGVPIILHAGRGMPPMDSLADVALRHPEAPLILAHGAIADQGMLTHRLRDHPTVFYDTSCFSALDVVELFARVPAERIVFGSDPPYGRPVGGLYLALRAAARAGLNDDERAMMVGGTVHALLEHEQLPPSGAPRLASDRPMNGRLARASGYLLMSFGAAIGGGTSPDLQRALPGIALARAVCRDPDPGNAGEALRRIDTALAAAEALVVAPPPSPFLAFALVHACAALAATEPAELAELASEDPSKAT
jgi:uncharacterized protein